MDEQDYIETKVIKYQSNHQQVSSEEFKLQGNEFFKLKKYREGLLDMEESVSTRIGQWCNENTMLFSKDLETYLMDEQDYIETKVIKYQSNHQQVSSEEFKLQGNEFFKLKKYREAIKCYTRAINIEESVLYYGNRAICYMHLKQHKKCIQDCTKAIALDDQYIKGYLVRANTYMVLNSYEKSLKDYQQALRLQPRNSKAKSQIKKLQLIIEEENQKAQQQLAHQNMMKQEELTPENIVVPPKPVVVDEIVKEPPQLTIPATIQKITVPDYQIPDSPPSSFYEFEIVWRNIGSNQEKKLVYLQLIPLEKLKSILSNSITSPLIASIFSALDFSEHSLSIVETMTKLPRFSMLSMMITGDNRKIVNNYFRGLQECGTDPSMCSHLLQCYRVSI
eukprot:TRINITY_DN10695_c0_g1_i1.p1 TRINITY_DN10695_c0_g1~~TRINITY_DN10695_c0_g1_i1.p1  ORF type:complete len:431 (+),score=56.70 TRINITY_DN10695_c0_g1_i1:119-1294(+)